MMLLILFGLKLVSDMECSVRLVNIQEEDFMNGGNHYKNELLSSICDGIWFMDQCLSRDDVAQLGRMLIRMAYSRDTHLRYPKDFVEGNKECQT